MATAKKPPAAPAEDAGDGDEAAGDEAKFYCPGCGKRSDVAGTCTGKSAEAPHPPIEYVSTKELAGDPEKHTAAPGVV